MKSVDLLIFDLDGTLASTGEDLAVSVNFALRRLGLRVLDKDMIISFVGDGIRTLLTRAIGPQHQLQLDDAVSLFTEYYNEHTMDHTVLYPGAVSCLDHFRCKKKIVISNKQKVFVDKILNHLGILHHFVQTIGGDSMDYMKPDARLVTALLSTFNLDPGKVLMIGDGKNDILLAKNTGIMSCAFLGGLTKREILLDLSPDFTCENLAELPLLFY